MANRADRDGSRALAAPANRLIQAAAGPAFRRPPARARVSGRIGGFVGIQDPAAEAALRRALGPGAQVIAGASAPGPQASAPSAGGSVPPSPANRHCVVDADCCWLDEAPLLDAAAWAALQIPGDLARISGAFALAASDGESLLLARDALGERSLFYAPVPGGLLFASTLHALLATGLVERVLDPVAIARYLSYAYLPGRATLVAGIKKLLPGECVRYRDGRLTRWRHWELPSAGGEPADAATLRRRLRARLEDAVRRRLPSGAVGATLSGGVDSSLVVALASRLHTEPVAAFSVSFGAGYPNELAFSSLVAAHCGTTHRVVELSAEAIVRHLDESIGLLSDPIGDPLTVPNALLFREAAAEVSVVLNGEGGDPCFGGPKNLPMLLSEWLEDGCHGAAADGLERERRYLRAHQKCYDDLDALLEPALRDALDHQPLETELAAWFADPRFPDFVTRLMAMNVAFKGAHHILAKVDATSAAFGVTPRAPLFDRAVVELAFAIPPQLKLRGSVEKHLLKEAVRDLLPAAIVERPKSGMLVPVEGWFRGPLLPEARARLLDGLRPYRLLRQDYLGCLLDGQQAGLRPRRGVKIWLLVTLEAWLRTVFAAR